ncbi:hypothetical protein [Nonomuraea fuscirosea]
MLTRRGPGRKQAVLLPIEAAAVWQRGPVGRESDEAVTADDEW